MTLVQVRRCDGEYQFLANELIATQMKFEVLITDAGGKILHSIELIRENVRTVLS